MNDLKTDEILNENPNVFIDDLLQHLFFSAAAHKFNHLFKIHELDKRLEKKQLFDPEKVKELRQYILELSEMLKEIKKGLS